MGPDECDGTATAEVREIAYFGGGIRVGMSLPCGNI